MLRTFDTHHIRQVQDLCGTWNFAIDPEDRGEAEGWFSGLPVAEEVAVPSVWNTQLGLLEYEGAAWYQRTFYTDGGCLRFCFGAVMTLADVWLDGMKLGSHYGGFCQFDFIAPDVAAGVHTLTVRADNRFDAHAIPMPKVDWYHYGGITRDVTVETLKGICVLHNRLEYTLSEDLTSANARFVLELYNAESGLTSSAVAVALDGKQVYSVLATMEANASLTVTTPDFTVSDVRLWNVGSPELYDISCTTDTDDLLDRTGFRLVEVVGQSVCINGKPLEIRGVNRHEEHPDWGMAFPVGLMKRDLDIIEDLGCNAVRGSHYPNNPAFVDMLDTRGITFWSEVPFWGHGYTEESAGDPIVVERGMMMHKEMVKYYYNHPSIILWGMHNEMPTETQAMLEMTKLFYPYLKEHGGNRLVTYATDRPAKDICLEYCDIICLNRYAGWYYKQRDEWQLEMDAFRERREALGLEHKPVIYSEFGGAAIYGHHTFDDLRGTEEYQATMLDMCLKAFHADSMVCGFYIWQFCDMRTCRQMGLDRARSYNNKGILNEYRKPKMAYHTVKKCYHGFAEEEK